MPTYEYECSKCGHAFDFFQSITEKPLQTCPKERCPRKPWGKGEVKRVIGAGAGLIFKGSGFYITDYRSEKYKEAAKKEASAASPPATDKAKGTTSKADAKPSTSSSSSSGTGGSSSGS
jgi:putative FmdB family regulatory protein